MRLSTLLLLLISLITMNGCNMPLCGSTPMSRFLNDDEDQSANTCAFGPCSDETLLIHADEELTSINVFDACADAVCGETHSCEASKVTVVGRALLRETTNPDLASKENSVKMTLINSKSGQCSSAQITVKFDGNVDPSDKLRSLFVNDEQTPKFPDPASKVVRVTGTPTGRDTFSGGEASVNGGCQRSHILTVDSIEDLDFDFVNQ